MLCRVKPCQSTKLTAVQLLPDLHSLLPTTPREHPDWLHWRPNDLPDLAIWHIRSQSTTDLLNAWFLGSFLMSLLCHSALSYINLFTGDGLFPATNFPFTNHQITQCMQKSDHHKWGWKYPEKRSQLFISNPPSQDAIVSLLKAEKSDFWVFIQIQIQHISRSSMVY